MLLIGLNNCITVHTHNTHFCLQFVMYIMPLNGPHVQNIVLFFTWIQFGTGLENITKVQVMNLNPIEVHWGWMVKKIMGIFHANMLGIVKNGMRGWGLPGRICTKAIKKHTPTAGIFYSSVFSYRDME